MALAPVEVNSRMKITLHRVFGVALLLASLLISLPVQAQEDDSGDSDEGWGKLIAEYGTWITEPRGLGNNVATVQDPTNIFNDTVIGFRHGTTNEDYSRVGAELAGNRGRLLLTWYAHDSLGQMALRDPGNFIYGELLALPLFAGLSNDGLADALDAVFVAALRDQKIEYSRVAFSNSRVEGRWNAGLRQVTFRQSSDATYHALVPSFPAFLPPLVTSLPNLNPIADRAFMSSSYEGSGLSGGFEIEAPLYRKLLIEASFGLSILAGTVDTSYAGTNSLYTLGGFVLEAPYTELDDYTIDLSGNLSGTALSVQQVVVGAGLQSHSVSRNTQILEASIGGRWEAMKFMDVFFGFRTISYGNVAVELRPRNVTVIGNTANVVDASETDRSATYEGFYGGIGFRF